MDAGINPASLRAGVGTSVTQRVLSSGDLQTRSSKHKSRCVAMGCVWRTDGQETTRGKLQIVVETHHSSEAFASVWGLVVDRSLSGGGVLAHLRLRRSSITAVGRPCAARRSTSCPYFHNNGPRARIEDDRKLGHPSNARSAWGTLVPLDTAAKTSRNQSTLWTAYDQNNLA